MFSSCPLICVFAKSFHFLQDRFQVQKDTKISLMHYSTRLICVRFFLSLVLKIHIRRPLYLILLFFLLLGLWDSCWWKRHATLRGTETEGSYCARNRSESHNTAPGRGNVCSRYRVWKGWRIQCLITISFTYLDPLYLCVAYNFQQTQCRIIRNCSVIFVTNNLVRANLIWSCGRTKWLLSYIRITFSF